MKLDLDYIVLLIILQKLRYIFYYWLKNTQPPGKLRQKISQYICSINLVYIDYFHVQLSQWKEKKSISQLLSKDGHKILKRKLSHWASRVFCVSTLPTSPNGKLFLTFDHLANGNFSSFLCDSLRDYMTVSCDSFEAVA